MPSKQTIVVLGSTGSQGGSVIQHVLKADPQHARYHIRATTRNPQSEKAKALAAQGVEMVQADFSQPDTLAKAFEGADILFMVTNFWDKEIVAGDQTLEEKQGKWIVDAAIKAKVGHIIFSSLHNCTTISNGKYDKVLHFDGKARIVEYIQSKGIPATFVEAGFFMTNLIYFMSPTITAEGVHEYYFPVSENTLMPAVDIASDYGAVVAKVVENPSQYVNQFLLVAGEYISFKDMFATLSKHTGNPIKFVQVPHDAYVQALSPMLGPVAAEEMTQMYEYIEECGYWNKKKLNIEPVMKRPGTTFEQWLKANLHYFKK